MDIILEIIKAIVLGIVEGVTEWLPVSSTGHMIVLQDVIALKVSAEFWKVFEIVVQLGAIMAVVLLFWRKLLPFKKKEGRIVIRVVKVRLWIKIIIACIPAAVVGLIFDDLINKYFYNPLSVAVALIVVGIFFIVIESRIGKDAPAYVNKTSEITLKEAFIIGIFQLAAAVFPGTSRSGATIIGGLILGLSRKVAAEFTFYLAIPVMFGASVLKIVKYFVQGGLAFTGMEIAILIIGTLTAFIVSLFVISFLMGYIRKHDFKIFGWYRIVLGVIIIVYSLIIK